MLNVETARQVAPAVPPAHPAPATSGTPSQSDLGYWEQVWFTLVKQQWTSLAIVPTHPQKSALGAARALAEVGRPYQVEPVDVLDAEQLVPGDVPAALGALLAETEARARVLIAVRSPLDHAAAIPLVRAADAAVLLVHLGESELSRARRTIACIGAAHFVGSITVAP
jgi:hypothetical protein